jgi:hypothetical protein
MSTTAPDDIRQYSAPPLEMTQQPLNTTLGSMVESIDFFEFAPEIRNMIYEEIHKQNFEEDADGLLYRYQLSSARFESVSKRFAQEAKYKDRLRTFEVTQTSLTYRPDYRMGLRMNNKQDRAWAASSNLVLNFNINEGLDGRLPKMDMVDLADVIRIKWATRQALRPINTPRVESSSITFRFWFCSMKAYDGFKFRMPQDRCDIAYKDGTKIELMFYECKDQTAFQNCKSVAGARVLDIYTKSSGWETDDNAVIEARNILGGSACPTVWRWRQ